MFIQQSAGPDHWVSTIYASLLLRRFSSEETNVARCSCNSGCSRNCFQLPQGRATHEPSSFLLDALLLPSGPTHNTIAHLRTTRLCLDAKRENASQHAGLLESQRITQLQMEWEGYKAPSDVKTCIQSEGPSDLDNQGLANTPTGVRIGAMQCKDEQEFKNGGERSCATPMTSEAKSCEANINDTNCVSPMPTKIKDQETVAGATQIESVGDLFDADSGIERSSNSGSNSNTEPQNQQTGEDLKQESTLNHATSISEVKATALLTEANQPADQHYEDSPPDAAADNRSSTSTQKSIVGQKRVAASPSSPSSTFSWNDILHVQNLIERCLQQYLTKVTNSLLFLQLSNSLVI